MSREFYPSLRFLSSGLQWQKSVLSWINHTHTHIYIYMHVYIYVYIYIYIYIYIVRFSTLLSSLLPALVPMIGMYCFHGNAMLQAINLVIHPVRLNGHGAGLIGHIATLLACSSDTFTNMLPNWNANTGHDTPPSQYTDTGPTCWCTIHCCGTSRWKPQLIILMSKVRPDWGIVPRTSKNVAVVVVYRRLVKSIPYPPSCKIMVLGHANPICNTLGNSCFFNFALQLHSLCSHWSFSYCSGTMGITGPFHWQMPQ